MVAKYAQKCLAILQLFQTIIVKTRACIYNITEAVTCYVRAKQFLLVAKTYRSTLSSKKFQMQNLGVTTDSQ